VLKVNVDLLTMLIGAEGARLLREDGAGETQQALKRRGGSRTARGKRSFLSANQQASLTQPKIKKSMNYDSVFTFFLLNFFSYLEDRLRVGFKTLHRNNFYTYWQA
jgi:hypothetical protein